MIEFEINGITYRAFDHLFAVSRCGDALRCFEPYQPIPMKNGYLTLGRRRLLHRAVAICWIPNPDNKPHVHHINGVKTDNRAENLEWITPREHMLERHGDHVHSLGKYTRTEFHRETLRNNRLGSITSNETKEKQRVALLGKTRPFFHRASPSKESLEQKSLTHPKNTGCVILGIAYRSYADASRATGINRFTIRKRCLSSKHPDYQLL